MFTIQPQLVESLYNCGDAEIAELIEHATLEDGTIQLPSRVEVCPRCHGKGVHDHPAFSNGFCRDDDFVEVLPLLDG